MSTIALVLALVSATSTDTSTSRDPVILDFHASWCGPCREMRKAIDLLVEKGYPVKSVDIDRAKRLAQRYQVESVPTFVIVDGEGRELARTEGLQPASNLASLYRQAKTKAAGQAAPVQAAADREADAQRPAPQVAVRTSDEDDDDETDSPAAALPRPWETVVRIRVLSGGMIGYGSGTIIHSTPEESLILTCAHIFKIEGAARQPSPAQFPRQIVVDLFDGQLHGTKPAMVHYVSSVNGKAVDYDFSSDVGLIVIKPGRKLPAARVVPPTWKPQPKMEMITVGCSEGRPATAWTTWIINPSNSMRVGGRLYQAIECVHAPKQGRSGGGLYTLDGHVAGVCDFAEPAGDHGLYAAPQSIYRMLDRNRLTALYNPSAGNADTLLAQNTRAKGTAQARKPAPAHTLRAQSPEANEIKRVTMPAPELLGINTPGNASTSSTATAASSQHSSWHTLPSRPALANASTRSGARMQPGVEAEGGDADRPIATEVEMLPSPADDPLTIPPPPDANEPPATTTPVSKPVNAGGWRAVSPSTGGQGALVTLPRGH